VAFSKTRTFLRSAGRYASEEGLSDEEADTLLAWELRELDPSYLEKSEHPELLNLALTTGRLLPVLEQMYQERATLAERARLAQHFTLMKAPDGVVDNLGYLELRKVAEALAVPSWLVDEALRGASNPLD
jgi:hypothetical protein